MAENEHPISEPIQKSAQAAHMIRGAVKAGKAISGAAKGAAVGGPAGAVLGFAVGNPKMVGKIIIAVVAFLMIPVMIICMLPAIIFGNLFGGGQPAASTPPIMNDNAAIQGNLNEISNRVESVLTEGMNATLSSIRSEYASSGADGYEIDNPYAGNVRFDVNLFIAQYCAANSIDYTAISMDHMEGLLRQKMYDLYSYSRREETRPVEVTETVTVTDPETGETTQQQVTTMKQERWLLYTVYYNGETYFADEVFQLTAQQKELAEDYAENLALFLAG